MVTVTVLRSGWWLPGRHLAAGDTLTLDAATAEALARRGIVRLPEPTPEPEPPAHSVASIVIVESFVVEPRASTVVSPSHSMKLPSNVSTRNATDGIWH